MSTNITGAFNQGQKDPQLEARMSAAAQSAVKTPGILFFPKRIDAKAQSEFFWDHELKGKNNQSQATTVRGIGTDSHVRKGGKTKTRRYNYMEGIIFEAETDFRSGRSGATVDNVSTEAEQNDYMYQSLLEHMERGLTGNYGSKPFESTAAPGYAGSLIAAAGERGHVGADTAMNVARVENMSTDGTITGGGYDVGNKRLYAWTEAGMTARTVPGVKDITDLALELIANKNFTCTPGEVNDKRVDLVCGLPAHIYNTIVYESLSGGVPQQTRWNATISGGDDVEVVSTMHMITSQFASILLLPILRIQDNSENANTQLGFMCTADATSILEQFMPEFKTLNRSEVLSQYTLSANYTFEVPLDEYVIAIGGMTLDS